MVFKNIKLFYNTHRALFIILTLTQILCAMIILFCFGTYLENATLMSEEDDERSYIDIKFNTDGEDNAVTMEQIRKEFPEILSGYTESLSNVRFCADAKLDRKITNEDFSSVALDELESYPESFDEFKESDSYKLQCIFMPEGDKYIAESYTGKLEFSCDYFTPEQLQNGELVCIPSYPISKLAVDGYLEIGGIKYKVLGNCYKTLWYIFNSNWIFVPLESMPDTAVPQYVSINFNRSILQSEYNDITSRFAETFNITIKDTTWGIISYDRKATLMTMMLVSVIMAFMAAVTVMAIYRFQIETRKQQIATFMLCGCTHLRLKFIYVGEMVFMLLLNAGVGIFLYFKIVLKVISSKFTYLPYVYTDKTYIWYLLLYLGVVAIFSGISIAIGTAKEPCELLRNREIK
jgi:hypothetical protein